jgi:hypothetical protein
MPQPFQPLESQVYSDSVGSAGPTRVIIQIAGMGIQKSKK